MRRREARLAPFSLRHALLLLVPLAVLASALLGLLAQSASAEHTPEAPSITGPASPGKSTTPTWTFSRPADGSTSTTTVLESGATQTVTIAHDYSTECVYDALGTTGQPINPCGASPDATSDSYTGGVTGDGTYALTVRTAAVTTTTTYLDDGTGSKQVDEKITGPVYSAAASASYLLDTTAPAISVTGPPGAVYTGWDVARLDSGGSAVQYSCRVTGPAGTGPGFTCNAGNVKPDLGSNGDYTLTVTATDGAANSTTVTSAAFTYDGVAPTVTVTRVTASPQSVQQPQWSYDGGDGTTYCILTGPNGFRSEGACSGGTYTAPVLTVSGTYLLTVESTDAAGNVGRNDPTTTAYVLDRTPPTVAVSPGGSTTGTDPGTTWTVTVGGAASVTCTVEGASSVSTTCTAAGGSVTASRTTDGVITLTVTAVDEYGNAAAPVTVTYTRDTTPAAPTVSVPVARGTSPSVAWTVTLGANTTGASCALTRNGSAATDVAVDCSTLTAPGTYTVTTALTTDGAYRLVVTAFNSTSPERPTGEASYTLDRAAAPGPTLTAGQSGTGGNASPLSWTWTVADGHTTECRLTIGTGTPTAWGGCNGSFSVTPSAQGSYLLEVQHVDDLGNRGSTSSASYLYDSVGPTPPTVALVGPSPRQSGSVTWNVTATDDTAVIQCRLISPGVTSTPTTPAWGTCGTSETRTVTGDGAHTLEVRLLDAAGNPSEVRSSSVVIDDTRPPAPVVSGTDSRGTTRTLTWSFSHASGSDGTSFRCRLLHDGSGPAEFTACTSNYSVTVTADGAYQLVVVSVDAAGNVSDPTAGPTHTVDTTGPLAPSVTLATTSGNTKHATWTVTRANDAVRSQCRLTRTAGGITSEVLAWTECAGYGFDLLAGDGVYVLQVRTYDDLGNEGAATTGPGYTLDATPPAAPAVSGSRTGTDNERTIQYTFSGEGTPACALYRDGRLVTTFASCASPFEVTLPSVDGVYTLRVTYTDAFLNTSDPGESQPYTLDVTPPTTPTVTGSRTGTDNELAITYAFTGEGTAVCRLYRDGTLVQTTADCSGSPRPFAVTLPATSGSYVLTVTYTDQYGNEGLPGSSAPYVLDVTPPGLATVTVSPTTGNVRSATWTVTPPEQGTTSECRLRHTSGGVTTTVQDWHACTAPYTYSLTRDDGLYVLDVRLTDAVGNLGDVATGQGYLLDVTPPAVPTVTSDRVERDNERVVTYTFSGEGTATCRLMKDGVAVGTAVVGCTSGYVVTLPNESGRYVLLVTYTDSVGNTSAPGASPEYELDVTPPAAPAVGSDRSGTDNEPVVTYTFSGEGTATCQLTRNGVAVGSEVACTSPYVVTLPSVDGSYVLLVRYTDAVGNTGAAGASVAYLLDLTPPPAPVVSGPPATGNTRAVSWSYTGEGTATCTLLRDGVAVGGQFACGAAGFSTTLTADGSWTLQVAFTDAVGNRGPPGTSTPYLLDTVAPAAPRTSGPTGPSQSRTPAWTVGTDAGTTTECRLVRGGTVVNDWAACAGGFSADLTALPDGGYVLESRATDAAGNVSAVGASTPYVLDTTAPAAPVVTGPTGPSQLRTPSFTWTGEAGARAECQLTRDGVVVGGWVACTSGYAPSLAQDGTWTLAVRLVDAAGNVGDAASSGGYVLDTTAPAAPVVTPPSTPGRDLAPSWGAVVEGGSRLECRLLGADGVVSAWAACTLPHVTSLTGRPDGAYVLEVRATDAAGNMSAVGSGSYVLDTVAPAAAVVVAPASPGRTRTPSFTFTTEAGATTRCRLTSGTTLLSDFAPCTSPTALDLTGLADGTYTLTVRVTDAAGNPGAAATGTYVLDTTGPAAPVFTLTPGTPSPARTVTWAFSYEPGSTLVCRLTFPSGAVREIAACASPLRVDLSGLPDGSYTLTVRAVDAAGNVGAAATDVHVLDSTALLAPEVTGPVSPGSDRTPTWSLTVAVGTAECRLVRGTTVLRDWAACSGSYTADLFGQPDGTYALQVRARTATAVSGTTSSRYVLDSTPPAAATLVAPPTPSTNRQPTWTIASPEAGATAMCRVLVFGSVLRDWTPCAVSPAGSLHTVDLTGLGDGTYTLVVRLTDAAGNVGTTTASADYVLDTSAPVAVGVTGPPSPGNDRNPTWLLTTGGGTELECRLSSAAGVVSDWTPCAGEYTADLTDLPDGTYTLAVRAVSAAGTPGPETTSAYVLSTTGPTAPSAVALSGVKSPSNNRAPTWTFTLPAGTTGFCRVVQGTREVYAGACSSPFTLDLSSAADGTYTLTVSAVDAAGNRTAAGPSTYVLDTEPTEQPLLTQVPGATGSTLDPQWRFTVARGATAQCRLLYNGSALDDWASCTSPYTAVLTGRPDGRYVLQVRAVDAAGNTSAPVSDTYLLDRTAPPVVTFTTTPQTPDNATAVTWTFTAPEGGTLQCRLSYDGRVLAEWGPCGTLSGALRTTRALAVTAAGTYRLDLAGRPDGDYLLQVRVVQADGAVGAASGATYRLDTRAPAAPAFSDTPAAAGNSPTPTWLWEAGGDVLVECRLVRVGGPALTAWSECADGQYVADLTRFGQGTYALEIRLTDAAGNVSPTTSASYRYDTTAPAAPVFTARPPAGGADRTISWSFTVPPDTTATCTVTRDFNVIRRESACSGRYDLNLGGLPDGTYTLTVRYTDSAGNVSRPSSSSYAFSTLRAGGPVRVDPPVVVPPFEPPTGGGTVSPPVGPGRGGTGTPPVPAAPARGGSTSGPRVPTIPTDDDVVRLSDSRPRGTAPSTAAPNRPAAAPSKPDPKPSGNSNPLLPEDFVDAPVPDVIKDVAIGTFKRPTLPLALLAIVVLFLLAQNRIDRRDPKLAAAPVDAEPELDFTAFIRRPEGAQQ